MRPDDETMTAFSLSVAKLGNVKTQTLRAFSGKEMAGILVQDGVTGDAASVADTGVGAVARR